MTNLARAGVTFRMLCMTSQRLSSRVRRQGLLMIGPVCNETLSVKPQMMPVSMMRQLGQITLYLAFSACLVLKATPLSLALPVCK